MKFWIPSSEDRESGQIVVLLAVAMVVVMGAAALAIDGGMLYSERRFAQNAADSASLAGGGAVMYSGLETKTFNCPLSSTYSSSAKSFSDSGNLVARAVLAARSTAAINGITNLPYLGYVRNGTVKENYGISENHGVIVECDTRTKNKYLDTLVRVTSQISTAFAQLVFSGDLKTTNHAVTRVEPGHNFGYGNAIVSLSDTCKNTGDGGTYFAGSAVIKIKGAGTHSNSCLVANGTSSLEVNLDDGKNLNLVYENANLNPAGAFPYNGSQETLQIDYPDEPVCGSTTPAAASISNSTVTLSPGNYSSISITGGQVTFSPGLYCLTGDMSVTGGRAVGDGVTFFVKKDGSKNTDVKITGNATVLLSAPTDSSSKLFGILFFMDDANKGSINLVGSNNSYFSGLVYAPSGFIDIGGTSSVTTFSDDVCALIDNLLEDTCQATTFSTQFIGKSVRVKGDGTLDILFDETALPGMESSMHLQE